MITTMKDSAASAAEFFEFRDGQHVTRFRGWLLQKRNLPITEHEQIDRGFSGSITETVCRVEGGEILQANAQETNIRRSAWAVCIAEYRSDGKFDERPLPFRQEITLTVKLFRDRAALLAWSPSINV